MSKRIQFQAISASQFVDAVAGTIRGVSVITIGEAETHDLWIDGLTLSKLAELSAGGVKVKINHPKRGEDPSFEATAGQLSNFRVEGNQLKADLELLKSEKYFDKIIEMAQKMPEEFGLSVRIAFDTEEKDKKKFIRPTAIESVDLVDAPAANPNGLFSTINKNDSKKPMSAVFAKALGLPETATEDQIAAELMKRLSEHKPTDMAGLSKQAEDFNKKIEDLAKKAKDADDAARKTEIAALVAEASREGKVIPLTDAQLAKMEVADIKEMFTKLPKGQVQMTKKQPEIPAKDGVRLRGEALVAFCRQKRDEGAELLNQQFSTLN